MALYHIQKMDDGPETGGNFSATANELWQEF